MRQAHAHYTVYFGQSQLPLPFITDIITQGVSICCARLTPKLIGLSHTQFLSTQGTRNVGIVFPIRLLVTEIRETVILFLPNPRTFIPPPTPRTGLNKRHKTYDSILFGYLIAFGADNDMASQTTL